MNKKRIEGYVYTCEFTYSGCGKREYLTKEFTALNADDLNKQVNEYLQRQNAGEPKSDRIRRNGIIKRIAITSQSKTNNNEK